jgi:hypothetical protein
MSNVISIRNNFPKVAAQLDRLGKEVGNKAMVRALNETVRQGKTAMARQISKEFRVKVGDAKDRLDVDYAKAKGGGIRFSASLMATRAGGLHNNDWRGMNLIHFVTSEPTRNKKGKLGQLKFQIKRTGGRKSIKGAFIATNRKTGGRAVFVREGKSRMPIKTLTTIDVPQMFNTRRVNSVIRTVMQQRFDINFQRQLRAVLKGFAK